MRQIEVISTMVLGEISEGIDARLSSLVLIERSRKVREMVDLGIRGIEVEPIPSSLDEGERAILVSNYPSISQTLRALLKLGCRLPGEGFRLKAIARKEVKTEANLVLKALGIDKLVFPAQKDEAGVYKLERRTYREVLAYLDEPGHVLWLSLTGKTRGNGLLEGDLRTGAALFSVTKRVPISPMGLITKEERGKLKVVKVRFGEPIDPPEVGEMAEFERSDFLIDFSKLAMCEIAKLLLPGQRGDFENIEEKQVEIERRLGTY
jgi:hypothetical protein